MFCSFALIGCGGSEVKKEVEKKEEKKWVRNETEEYKKVVADYELVGKWEMTYDYSGGYVDINECYKKGRNYKWVSFWGDEGVPIILDYKKKGDKYFWVKGDTDEYYKIVDGNLQAWLDGKHLKDHTYRPIDW